MKPIKFENEDYKDKLTVSTEIRLTIRERIELLFSPKIIIKFEVYCKEEMPPRRTIASMITTNYIDILKIKYRKWRLGDGGLVEGPAKELGIKPSLFPYNYCTSCLGRLERRVLAKADKDVLCEKCDSAKPKAIDSVPQLEVNKRFYIVENKLVITIRKIDREENELDVTVTSSPTSYWQETWNLEHTEVGFMRDEYRWVKKEKS